MTYKSLRKRKIEALQKQQKELKKSLLDKTYIEEEKNPALRRRKAMELKRRVMEENKRMAFHKSPIRADRISLRKAKIGYLKDKQKNLKKPKSKSIIKDYY